MSIIFPSSYTIPSQKAHKPTHNADIWPHTHVHSFDLFFTLSTRNFVNTLFHSPMEQYIVSARKYRPSTFKSVVGQQSLTHTLKSAIDSGHLAHAYLFCGPRGVGKTSCARIFAKTINCLHPTPDGEACNECESCTAFNEQRSLNIVELDAASNNSVDDIRNLIEQVRIPPQIGRYRVFIIDEVHMLSTAAFNAFLKTLEEPPSHAIFILATTEKHKILPTILSRCQIYDFSRITIPDIVVQLKYIADNEGISAEPAALNVIAQKADGAMRDALSIFDQVAASSGGNITYTSTIENLNVLDHDHYFRLMEAFRTCNVTDALLIYKEIRDKGFDSLFFINGLAKHIRDMMVAATPQTHKLLDMGEEVAARFISESIKFHPKFYYLAMDLCNTCDLNYRTASNKQFLVELTLIKICRLLQQPTPPTGDNSGGGNSSLPIAKTRQQASTIQQSASTNSPRNTATPAQTPNTSEPKVAYTPRSNTSAAAPAKHGNLPGNMPRIMINNQQAGNNTTPTANVQPSQRHLSAFTPEQMLSAWNQYIESHPSEKVIVNTMRAALPSRVNDTLYEIYVENVGQVEFIKTRQTEIVEFLRQRLDNDMVAIDVKVKESGPEPKFWSPREIIEDMVQRNPDVRNLIQEFGLSLT